MTRASIMSEPNGHVTTRECERCRLDCSKTRWAAWAFLLLIALGAYGYSWNNKTANQTQFQASDARMNEELAKIRETAIAAKARADAQEQAFTKLERTIDKLGIAVDKLDSTVNRLDAKWPVK